MFFTPSVYLVDFLEPTRTLTVGKGGGFGEVGWLTSNVSGSSIELNIEFDDILYRDRNRIWVQKRGKVSGSRKGLGEGHLSQ